MYCGKAQGREIMGNMKQKQGIVALTTQKVVTTSNTSFKRDLKVFDNTFTYEISSYKDQLYILHFFGRLGI